MCFTPANAGVHLVFLMICQEEKKNSLETILYDTIRNEAFWLF